MRTLWEFRFLFREMKTDRYCMLKSFLRMYIFLKDCTVVVDFLFAKKKPKLSQSPNNFDSVIFGFIFVRFYFHQKI